MADAGTSLTIVVDTTKICDLSIDSLFWGVSEKEAVKLLSKGPIYVIGDKAEANRILNLLSLLKLKGAI